jgi:hypothetical protein
MGKLNVAIVCCLIALIPGAFGQSAPPDDRKAHTAVCPDNLFGLDFSQNGGRMCPQNGIVYLARGEFKLRFFLGEGKTLYVNFSRNPALYEAVVAGGSPDSVLEFGGTGMAEYELNPGREIVLIDRAWHVWPTPEGPDDTYNRFDRITRYANGFLCERTVENVNESDTEAPGRFTGQGTVYMVYCDVSYTEAGYRLNAVQTVKIIFE